MPASPRATSALGLALLVLLSPACSPDEALDLPAARLDGSRSLENVLAARRSVRAFTSAEPTRAQIAQLLWAAQGVTARGRTRTAPSAGALYPLDVYVATRQGVFRYVPSDHRLARVGSEDVRGALHRAALGQAAVQRAPVVFVITGDVSRTRVKYGARAQRYVYMEAGHAAQNLLLQATALGLGAVPIGAFSDGALQRTLGCAGAHAPLYVIPVGTPAATR